MIITMMLEKSKNAGPCVAVAEQKKY